MPFLRFHAVEKSRLDLVGERLISEIVRTLGCPRETVVIEAIDSSFISGHEQFQAYPFVKVEYFKRPLEQQNAVAKIIFEEIEKAVIFLQILPLFSIIIIKFVHSIKCNDYDGSK